MLDAIGSVLPMAVGVALSPVPVIATILMLFSSRARTNGPAFLAGWLLGLGAAVAVTVALSGAADLDSSDSAMTGVAWGKVVLGLVFLVMAVRQWRSRPVGDAGPELPRWMDAVDGFSPGKAFAIAALLSGVNPKNLGLAVAAATTVAGMGLAAGESTAALIVFVLLASTTIIVPVLYSLLGGDGAARRLDDWKAWLTVNNATVMTVVLLVLGAKVLGDGLVGA